jgi:hypothetical protein
MFRSHPTRKIILTLGVLLALLGAVALIVPVTAQEPVPGLGAPPAAVPVPVSGDVFAATVPLSITVPHPYPPYPPISRTVIINYPWPLPWWCNWPTPVPPPVPPGVPTPVPPTPIPSPTPGGAASAATYELCPQIASKVPAAVQQQALAAPWTIYGYNLRRNPNVPAHPMWNPLRTYLGLMNFNKPYSICNPVVWKAGCP